MSYFIFLKLKSKFNFTEARTCQPNKSCPRDPILRIRLGDLLIGHMAPPRPTITLEIKRTKPSGEIIILGFFWGGDSFIYYFSFN